LQISQVGIDLIKKFEGCSLRAYKPVKSELHFTIGYGHYGPDVKEGEIITQAKADALLKKDLQRFVDGVNKWVKVKLNQNQFDALVSFSFNLGLGNLSTSTLLEYVNHNDFERAANEFDKWIKAGGVVLAGLVKRRKEEKELFLKSTLPQPTKQEGVINLYNPGSPSLIQSTKNVLEKMVKEGKLNKVWVDKLEKGELTVSEATALLFVAIDRGAV
jgi:GH24 family phage-related lysozyme (muramidase)